MSSIAAVLDSAEKTLADAKISEPRMESEYLLAAFLKTSRAKVVLDRSRTLSESQLQELQHWLKKRESRMPLAYVSGEQPFRHLSLEVSPAVLVPRPETELLVEKCLETLAARYNRATVVDVGTGSGNIAISLTESAHVARVIAIDRSLEALQVAKRNAARAKTRIAIEWMEGNLLSGLRDVQVDLIAANLPYVASADMKTLEPELGWEPVLALDGGSDGLRAIEPCIKQAFFRLKPGGTLLLEIGSDQAGAVTKLFEREGHWTNIAVFDDLTGLPRIVHAVRKG